MSSYHFVVPMRCAPKARPRVDRYGTHMPDSYTKWKSDFAMCTPAIEPLAGPVAMCAVTTFADAKRGDGDNLIGSPMDALNGMAYADDRQVCGTIWIGQGKNDPPVAVTAARLRAMLDQIEAQPPNSTQIILSASE